MNEALKEAVSQDGSPGLDPEEVKATVKEAVRERVDEMVKQSLEESQPR